MRRSPTSSTGTTSSTTFCTTTASTRSRATSSSTTSPSSQGKDGDPVLAEAQDGSGRNNANFAHPAGWLLAADADVRVAGLRSQPAGGRGRRHLLRPDGRIRRQPGRPPDRSRVELVLANDGTAPTSDGCEPFPANSLVGKIPLIDRGTCTFVVKVKNAQNAGAAAAVVANNVAGPPIGMGGADPTITIPSIMISLADGDHHQGRHLPAAATLSPNRGSAARPRLRSRQRRDHRTSTGTASATG